MISERAVEVIRRRLLPPSRSRDEPSAIEGVASPPTSPLCNAPFVSMHLEPSGDVRACCQNRWQLLGNVGATSLRSIWNGEPLKALRARVAGQDLSLGCELCDVCHRRGDPESAFSRTYDHLAPGSLEPIWPRSLELALSNSCNLQCIMCNGDLSSTIRIRRERRAPLERVYGDAFFDELDLFLPHLEQITFLGGEPFLSTEGLRVMERLIELELTPRCHVTTNGTVWNDRVERIVNELPMHVAVSFDAADATTFEKIRCGAAFDVVVENLRRFAALCSRTRAGASVAFSMMPQNWSELFGVLELADQLDIAVFVNRVTYPPRNSLHHCPIGELEECVQVLERTDDECGSRLSLNRGIWLYQIESVRSLLAERTERSSFTGPDPSPDHQRLEHARSVAHHPAASLRGLVIVDDQQLIRRIEPDPADVLDLDLSGAIGESLNHAFRPMAEAYGDLESSELVHHQDGVEERSVRFVRDGTATVLSAALATTSDGWQRWYLGLERTVTAGPQGP